MLKFKRGRFVKHEVKNPTANHHSVEWKWQTHSSVEKREIKYLSMKKYFVKSTP